jgi:hypothetical protein
LFGALQALLPDVDALLAVPDPAVFNSQTAANILAAAYRRRIPMIGFSPAYTRAGALVSLYSTPAQVGTRRRNCARRSAVRILPPPQWPRDFVVRVNQDVSRSLGLTLVEERNSRSSCDKGKGMNRTLRTRMLMAGAAARNPGGRPADGVFLVHSIDSIEQGLRTRGTAISRHLAGFAEFGIFSGQRTALAPSALGDSHRSGCSRRGDCRYSWRNPCARWRSEPGTVAVP